ncbi:hypothetical protein IMSAGC018_02006 [Lachnospiraceae bacterium]|nr:hypothetical protein IMSAGC018_02006 [Lachnospiraceae bacterium]
MEKRTESIYIVGAHSRAQTLAIYLQYLYPEITIEAYLYDNEEANPEKIGGICVLPLDRVSLNTEYGVYIGTRGIYHQKIIKHLRELGFKRIYPVTVEFDIYLRNEYLKKYFTVTGREFLKIDRLCELESIKTVAVYVVRSAADKPLHQHYTLKPYEKEIQAGAALTAKRLTEDGITDCEGDNISGQNKQFCELTALYWLWKHAKEEIIGLAHYRRHFLLPTDWIIRMLKNQVDVILPIPLYVGPSLEENYKSRHDPADWDYMMEYLRTQDEQEYQEARAFFQGNLYSPCNMFIMGREVLNDLCTWLFPILFAVSAHGGQKKDNYLNRYPGFLSERLITFFFEKNRGKYKVVYSDKNFLN